MTHGACRKLRPKGKRKHKVNRPSTLAQPRDREQWLSDAVLSLLFQQAGSSGSDLTVKTRILILSLRECSIHVTREEVLGIIKIL